MPTINLNDHYLITDSFSERLESHSVTLQSGIMLEF